MNNQNIDPKTADKALETLTPKLQEIKKKSFKAIMTSGAQSVGVSRVTNKLLEDDKPKLREFYKELPDTMTEIELSALALWAAEKRLEAIVNVDGQPLYKEGRAIKEQVVKILDLLDGKNKQIIKIIKITGPGTGYVDCANDLAALHPHVVARRDDIIDRRLMTAEEIERMGILPALLIDASGGGKDEEKKAKLLKKQAWTYFLNCYKEIRRYIEFLYFHEPEELKKYPKLRGK